MGREVKPMLTQKMKTLQFIDSEIKAQQDRWQKVYEDAQKSKKEIPSAKLTRIENKIEYLRGIKKYLESEPRQEYVEAEQKRLRDMASRIDDRFPAWCKSMAPKDADPKTWRTMFNRETGLTKVKKQLKTIEFILA